MTPTAVPIAAAPIKLDPISLILHASGPVFIVVWGLIAAAIVVWVITVLKIIQLARLARVTGHRECGHRDRRWEAIILGPKCEPGRAPFGEAPVESDDALRSNAPWRAAAITSPQVA